MPPARWPSILWSAGATCCWCIDDLTKHAAAYRQLSLLLRRPPGREAYPGDIFYIHSRLLERAAKLAPERGGGSLTALPIAETQAGNISAYIPTNLISITDGQIYLDPRLFYEDQKPAVDVGKSVSRVGGKTQAPVLKSLSESLRLEYAQFLELEVFTRFGTMVDERTRKVIEHGRRIRAVLAPAAIRSRFPWRAGGAAVRAERRRARWVAARSRRSSFAPHLALGLLSTVPEIMDARRSGCARCRMMFAGAVESSAY